MKNQDKGQWAPAQINDESYSFQSKTFLIRYCEEEIELNEICSFRTEIDAYPINESEVFYLVCELYCCDINQFGISQKEVLLSLNIKVEGTILIQKSIDP